MIRAEPAPSEPSRAPAWARLSGSFRENSEAEALYFAGAALAALDSVVRSDPSWAGVWRRRLALKSAAAAAQNLLKRREDEAALRDPIALARPGQELGPAGRVYAAFRVLAGPGDLLRPGRLSAVAADLQAPLDSGKAAEIAAALRETGGRGRPAPVVARPRRLKRSLRSSPAPSRSRFGLPTPRWRKPSTGRSPRPCSPASFSCAAPQARDGGRARARPAG